MIYYMDTVKLYKKNTKVASLRAIHCTLIEAPSIDRSNDADDTKNVRQFAAHCVAYLHVYWVHFDHGYFYGCGRDGVGCNARRRAVNPKCSRIRGWMGDNARRLPNCSCKKKYYMMFIFIRLSSMNNY